MRNKKIKCISNNGYIDFLTINKIYEFLDETDLSFTLMSDTDQIITVDKIRFYRMSRK